MAPKAPTTLEIVWTHDLVFEGKSGHAAMILDSAGKEGPSPVQALVFALAGCMGMDVVYILQKGRHELRGLKVSLVAERAPGARRTSLDLLRGVAVLVMIEAHVIDSWTRAEDRHSHAFAQSLVLGGF